VFESGEIEKTKAIMSSDNEDSAVAGGTVALPPPKITFRENKKLYLKNMAKNFGKSIWNSKKKRFLGRDGEDWSEPPFWSI
jgi:hypothetical protein